MSVTITKRLTKEKLVKILPRGYAPFAPSLQLTEPITALVFDDSVVTSSLARKGVTKAGVQDSGSVLFVARDFTVEARQLIEQQTRATFGFA